MTEITDEAPSAALKRIHTRLSRAYKHIDNINRHLGPFVNSKTHKIVAEKNADGTEHYRRIFFKPDPNLDAFGVLIGEVIYQLRSALDNAVCELVTISGNIPTRSNGFPIFKNRKDFRKAAPKALHGLKPNIIAVIENYQPFQVGGDKNRTHALWLLHELNNADKHRIVLPVLIGHSESKLRFPKGTTAVEAGRIENGAILLTIFSPTPVDEVKVDFDATFEIGVEVGEARLRLSDIVTKLADEVVRVINDLEPFFTESPNPSEGK